GKVRSVAVTSRCIALATRLMEDTQRRTYSVTQPRPRAQPVLFAFWPATRASDEGVGVLDQSPEICRRYPWACKTLNNRLHAEAWRAFLRRALEPYRYQVNARLFPRSKVATALPLKAARVKPRCQAGVHSDLRPIRPDGGEMGAGRTIPTWAASVPRAA